MVGVTDLHTIAVEKTLFGPEADIASRTKAKADAAELAGKADGRRTGRRDLTIGRHHPDRASDKETKDENAQTWKERA